MMINDIIIYYSIRKTKQKNFIQKFFDEDINPKIKKKYIFPLFTIITFISILLSSIFVIMSHYNKGNFHNA